MPRRRRPRQAKPQDSFVLIVILGILVLIASVPTFFSAAIYYAVAITAVLTAITAGIYYYFIYRKQRAERQALLALEEAEIDILSGIEFEKLVAEVLRQQGYFIRTTAISGDYGVDLIATKDGIKTAVQCKRYSKPVSLIAVQQAHTGMAHYACQRSMVVTNSIFTKSAIELARSSKCTLVDREKLGRWLVELNQ